MAARPAARSSTLPFGVAVDSAGNLYIAEFGNNRVRKVATNGNISTLAGNGVSGFSGDGGQARQRACSTDRRRVAVDARATSILRDTANNRVRKVAANGVITTVAGNGDAGYLGRWRSSGQRAGGQPRRAGRR